MFQCQWHVKAQNVYMMLYQYNVGDILGLMNLTI